MTTQIEHARAELAKAEQALEIVQQKANELQRREQAQQRLPLATDVSAQIDQAALSAGLAAIKEQIRRELSDASAMLTRRRSELERAIENGAHACERFDHYQARLSGRQAMIPRAKNLRIAAEQLMNDDDYEAFRPLVAAAQQIIRIAEGLEADVRNDSEMVAKLKEQALFWGRP